MKLSKRLSKYIEDKKIEINAQINTGKVKTEQMKADKLREKKEKMKYLQPGTIRYGLAFKQGPMDVMKAAYEKRKFDREQKQAKVK
jgi:hypothetical protein